GCVKRVLSLLEELSENDKDKYATVWKEFGRVLKEGVGEDYANKERIAKLLRFSSTREEKEEETVSLADYVSRMKEGQDKVYYITAESFGAARASPHLEIFRKKGVEVLLMHDRVDEWVMANLTEFEGKKLQSVAKCDHGLGTLEVNPHHPLVSALKHESDEKRFADWSHILLDQAVLAEGGQLDEPGAFVKRLNELMLDMAGSGKRIWTPGS